ncbi:MAG TPA: hypothetical protein VIK91_22145 [Nannocystis sp.]
MAYCEKFMRTLTILLALSPLSACGEPGSGSSGTTSGPGTTTGTTTGTTETTSATTEVTSSGTTSPTSSTSAPATTGPGTTTTMTGVTGSTGETSGETTTGETTTSSTGETTGETTTSSTGTTGEPVGFTCEQDSDCQVHTDCCTCDVLAKDELPPPCGIMECLIDVCSTLDIGAGQAVCRFGRCTFEKVNCNPAQVLCDALPPNCPPGQLPSVSGACWSGQCAPVEACDWAPDCATCQIDVDPLVCVFKLDPKNPFHVCEPKPADCGDAPEIDCGCGAEICEASPPYTSCEDQVPGIACECPFC